MFFAKERVEVIAAQLKKRMIPQKFSLTDWRVKKGFWLHPEDADADGAPFEAFDSNTMHWYGPDEHYWFRTEFTVPQSFAGKPLWIHLRTQIEEWDDAKNPQFLVFIDGEALQGADMNHREIPLSSAAEPGRRYVLDLQAYTGTLHTEFHLLADVEELVPAVKDLYYDLQMPLWALGRMDAGSKTYIDLCTALNDAINLLDLRMAPDEAFYASVDAARAKLAETLYGAMAGRKEVIASCVGHTHIDVAWWWTVAQTREKAARSFATVLRLMEEYPEYKFMSSQPVLYTFVKERYPELHEQIRRRVAEGRWEPEGGMWLESDTNLPCGESLVRQFLYGKRFFREEFGVDNRVLWLPDVFGYSGALPQIMKKCGVDYFMTTKLSWNQFNKVPNDTLWWEGIDGSRVLAHFISTLGVGQSVTNFFTTYNGLLHPDAIMGGWERYQNKEMNNDILISYGYGDGGGGPTREMLETGRRMEKGVKGIPTVRQCGVLQYFTELEARVAESPRMPKWTGEFYFEYHRGTYTSMARNKRANRKSELLLRDAELLGALAALRCGAEYPAAELEALWKMVLLNQFHDILPGSCIREVYEVTKREYEEIARRGAALVEQSAAQLAGAGGGVAVFNTLGAARGGLVALDESVCIENAVSQTVRGKTYCAVENVPAKGWRVFAPGAPKAAETPFRTALSHGASIETPYYRAVIGEDGMFCSLFDKENGREVFRPGQAGNRMRVFEDKPIYYDNWDIDIFYTEKGWDLEDVAFMKWTAVGPLLAELTIERAFMHSRMRQRIRFYAHSRRIDFDTWVDWREHQYLLKVFMPVDVHTNEATFEIQFGNVTRPTHTNTSWDQARFESCGHRWMDVSEGGYGVSLLNDCKYGHSVNGAEVALTLIKSGIEPNPESDNEEHAFTYALLPHAGAWRDANTPAEAEALNQPLFAVRGGNAGERFGFAAVGAKNAVLETVKQAERGSGVVLRLYENSNTRTRTQLTLANAPVRAWECDLLENPQRELSVKGCEIDIELLPYEIKTVLVEF